MYTSVYIGLYVTLSIYIRYYTVYLYKHTRPLKKRENKPVGIVYHHVTAEKTLVFSDVYMETLNAKKEQTVNKQQQQQKKTMLCDLAARQHKNVCLFIFNFSVFFALPPVLPLSKNIKFRNKND